MISSGRQLARWGALATVTMLGFLAVGGPVAAQDAPTGPTPHKEGRVGDATVVEGDSERALARGGSATKFSLALPDGAACPGDSATGNWRIQSFLVPATDDPGTFTYQSTKPAGEGRWALYPLDTRSYINRLTAVANEEGGPGVIDERPVFSFVLFPPGTLPDGSYKVGFACTRWNETYRYWDTEIIITNTDADEPAQLEWEVAGGPAASGSSSSSSAGPVVIGLVVVILAGAVVAVVIRRGRRTRPLVSS
jgi:hypothetical protein